MKGDLKQQTGDQGQDHSGVQMQQGQVRLDHDWNAQRNSPTACICLLVLSLVLIIVWILVCERRLSEGRPQ